MKKNNKGNAFVGWVIATLLIWIFLFYVVFSVKIPVGNVWIKVNMYGSDKWVSIYTLKTWRNWYNPITSDVYKYSTFIQQKVYEQASFQDTDWLSIKANIWMDYKFDEAKISKIFEEYRADSDKITNIYMATWLKNSINRASATFKVDELYWPKKEEFRLLILDNIKKDFEAKWIIINNIYFVWDMSLPEQVMGRINAKIEATQTAIQKENELRAVEADAQKKIAEAKWNSESVLINARAEAEAIKIKSQAIISQGWKEYVELQAIQKWNWVLPQVSWWNTPFINLNK